MKQIITLTLLSASTLALAAEPVDSAGTVIDILRAAGYAEVRDVEMDDGIWEVEVRGADGRYYDLHVVPSSGEILDSRSDKPLVPASEVRSMLEAEGYTKVHDLDLDEAVWKAEATAADGSRVDLTINGFDGTVLASSVDD